MWGSPTFFRTDMLQWLRIGLSIKLLWEPLKALNISQLAFILIASHKLVCLTPAYVYGNIGGRSGVCVN